MFSLPRLTTVTQSILKMAVPTREDFIKVLKKYKSSISQPIFLDKEETLLNDLYILELSALFLISSAQNNKEISSGDKLYVRAALYNKNLNGSYFKEES